MAILKERADGNVLLGFISRQKFKKKKRMLRSLKECKRTLRAERKRTRCPTLIFRAIRKVVLFLWNLEGPALFHVPKTHINFPASNPDPGIYIFLDLLDPNPTFRFDEIHVLMFQNLEVCKMNFFYFFHQN